MKPTGGLGNRMRVMHTALTFLYENGVDLEIIWHKNEILNCSIHSLFDVPSQIKVTERYETLPVKTVQKIDRQFQARTLVYDKAFYDQEIKELYQNGFDFKNLLNYASVYIETCQWLMPVSHSFSYMPLAPSIQAAALAYTSAFSEDTIGLHIRRADHEIATYRSPMSHFIRMADHEIDQNPTVNFFLATDCQKTEESMMNHFGDRLIVQPGKRFERDTPQGIQAALTDMLCLAATQKIYGSFYSSFSHVASLIGNTPRHVVDILSAKDETELEAQV